MNHAHPTPATTARNIAATVILGGLTLAGITYRVSHLTSTIDALIMIGTVVVFAGTFLVGARARGYALRSRARAAADVEVARRYNELAAARAQREANQLRAENERLRAEAAVYDEALDKAYWDEARSRRSDGDTIAFNQVVRPFISRANRAS